MLIGADFLYFPLFLKIFLPIKVYAPFRVFEHF
nr:MAG TPA: hypothetical protein [Caudoviricetes sp.]